MGYGVRIMTRSRQFRRVSTNHQEAAKQIGDLDEWDKRHGYDAGPPYVIKASAFHGKHLPLLAQAVEDMEGGSYDVLTFWAADRMWRGESLSQALAYVERVHAAGGKVEFVKDQHLNITGDSSMPAWVRNMLFAQAFGTANGESQRKRDRTLMDIAHHRDTGSIHGKPSWGLAVEGEKDAKRFVPTDEGRTWVPQIYAWVLDGDVVAGVARKLTEAGVGGGRRWSESVVNRLIRNPVYYGHRRNGGNLETEALVPFGVWQQANAMIDARRRERGGASKHPAPLLRPFCLACFGVDRDGCRNGTSSAYLNRYPSGRAVYKCMGSGPQRKGCGAHVIPGPVLDARVIERFGSSPLPQMTRRFIPGRDIAAELKDLNQRVAEAMARGDYALVAKLSQEAQEVSQAEGSRGRWVSEPSGITMGQHFRALDRDGQRAYLADHIIFAQRGGGDAVMVGEFIMNDDGDGGILDMWD
jgi:hypothetical protein